MTIIATFGPKFTDVSNFKLYVNGNLDMAALGGGQSINQKNLTVTFTSSKYKNGTYTLQAKGVDSNNNPVESNKVQFQIKSGVTCPCPCPPPCPPPPCPPTEESAPENEMLAQEMAGALLSLWEWGSEIPSRLEVALRIRR